MKNLNKYRIAVIGFVAALAAFIGNLDTIRNFAYRLTTNDPDLTLNIDLINNQKVVWSINGIPTNETSYVANFHVTKKGIDKLSNCNFQINIDNALIGSSDNTNRSIPRGTTAFNWHFEHKVASRDFYSSTKIQLICNGFSSNHIEVKF